MQRTPMPHVGRNDPCPCGSGKKYKNCHMGQDQARTVGPALLKQARETLNDKLVAFAQAERFAPEMAAAFDLFWDTRIPLDQFERLAPLQRQRFFDYFLHDYRLSEGERVIDLLAEAGPRLTSEERTVLGQWRKAVIGIFAINRADAFSASVTDLGQGGDLTIDIALPPPLAQPSVALVGRLARDGKPYLVRDFAMPLETEKARALAEWLKPRFSAYQEQRYGATWDTFMRDESHLVSYFFLEDPEFKAPPPYVERPHVDRDEEIARDLVRKLHSGIIIGTLEQHYSAFLDKPVEEWNNRSLRQLMADERGRERVELWLEILAEAEEARRAMGQPAYDVGRLRGQLGMYGRGVF
ncbi:MAG: SEC-C domain-containing protein [Anaerolineae bacterium]